MMNDKEELPLCTGGDKNEIYNPPGTIWNFEIIERPKNIIEKILDFFFRRGWEK